MSVQKSTSSKIKRQNFNLSEHDSDELREIFDIMKKDKETCSLADLNVALVFLEQQFNYKLEERVKQDIKDLESNIVEPELTFEQFKSLVTQYEDEAVNEEIQELTELLGEDKKFLSGLI